MSDQSRRSRRNRDVHRDPAPQEEGATTGKGGPPMPVDLSGPPGAKRTMALFLAGPVIWTVHFLLVYLVIEAGCTGSGPGLRLFQPPVSSVLTLAATAVAAAACLMTATLAYRQWRTTRSLHRGAIREPEHRAALSFIGFALSLLGVVTVLFVGLPALFLPAC